MPMLASKACLDCGKATESGASRCGAHLPAWLEEREKRRARRREPDQASAHQRGYTKAWSRASKGFLAKHPLCVEHLKRKELRASVVTDHIVPHRGDMKLFWDRSNWQALCEGCHNRKTAREIAERRRVG